MNAYIQIEWTYENVISNQITQPKGHLACLVLKYMLYCYKIRKIKPNVQEVINEIEFIKKLERKKATTIKSIKSFNIKWNEQITLKG